MAWSTSSGSIGANSSTANQASQAFTVTSTLTAGNVAVIGIAVDNNQTTDGDEVAVTGVVDSTGSNTWVKAAEFTNGQAGAQAGATISVWYSKLASTLTGGSATITPSFSNATSRDKSCISGASFPFGAGSTVSVQATATLANDAADPGSLDAATPSAEFLRARFIALESSDTTGITVTAGGWTQFSSSTTAGGGSAANMAIRGEWKISTGTGDASDPTCFSADCASVYVAFKESPLVAFIPRPNLPILQAVNRAARF